MQGAAAVALVVYVLQLLLRREIDPLRVGGKVVICEKCNRIQHPNCAGRCECGGKFDDFDNWTWIDD